MHLISREYGTWCVTVHICLFINVGGTEEIPASSGPADRVHVCPQGPIKGQFPEVRMGLGHTEEVQRGQAGKYLEQELIGE